MQESIGNTVKCRNIDWVGGYEAQIGVYEMHTIELVLSVWKMRHMVQDYG